MEIEAFTLKAIAPSVREVNLRDIKPLSFLTELDHLDKQSPRQAHLIARCCKPVQVVRQRKMHRFIDIRNRRAHECFETWIFRIVGWCLFRFCR